MANIDKLLRAQELADECQIEIDKLSLGLSAFDLTETTKEALDSKLKSLEAKKAVYGGTKYGQANAKG